MKFRSDFVTNSSSSCFVISSSKGGYTVDMVYELMRSLYLELQNKADQIYEYVERYGFTLQDIETDMSEDSDPPNMAPRIYARTELVNAKGKEVGWNPDAYYEKEIYQKFGVYLDEVNPTLFVHRPSWTSCSTYAEYIKHEKKRAKNDNCESVIMPFTITSSAEGLDMDTIWWLLPCIKENKCVKDGGGKCRMPTCRKEAKVPLFRLMGDYVIRSWDTEMPQYVNRKLSEISDFCCIHMG